MATVNSTFWGQREGIKPDLVCGRTADYLAVPGHFAMLACSTIVLGGFLRAYLKNSEVIVLTILSLIGFVVGRLAYNFIEVFQVIHPLLRTPSFSLYCYIAPLIIFLAALDVDFYILKNVLWQVLLTGLISFSTTFIITGFVAMKLNKESWDLQCCLLFSMTIGLTDPIHSVKSLKTIGISKMYTDIIQGESMIVWCVTCIFFGILHSNLPHMLVIKEFTIIMDFFLSILGSILFGYWCARIIEFVLTDLFSNTLTNVVLCISVVYMIFYIVEFLKMSGMVALVTVGLNLDSLSFKPKMEFIITKFLTMFSSVFQHMIYTFFGIIIGCGKPTYFQFHTITFTLILFITLNFVRLFTIVLVSPILMHSNYKYNWKWGVIIAWSGVKGIFSLLLAPEIYNLAEQKSQVPEMFLLYVQIISLMTMGINSNMMTYLAKKLGMCAISLPRQMAMRNAISHIQEIVENARTLFKTEKILTNVDWTVVEEKTTITYSIPSSACQPLSVSRGEEEPESPTDEVLIEEARLHVAIIQMIIILKRKYFHQHWNTLEFSILLIGIVDIVCVYFVKFKPDNMVLIQITVVIGYLRIIRFIPLIKTIIPLLISVADVQIKKRLSLLYSITKGYVKSQEDTKFLVKQISGRGSIYQKLYEILEINKRDAVRELGLIEHEGRDVVIALKTRQTIQMVIAKSLKHLSFLWSRGIIDNHEGIEMNKVLLSKIKALNNFPMAIPPPTPDNYLHKIVWLENKEVLIKFFKERAKLAYFDYGDVICKEGEMPQGIYLIISGMAILHSSPPTFGISQALRSDRESQTLFTEFCTCGDIIGELSCLLKREVEYTAICETILQACFISLEDLYEGFDVFWPFLEHKIWLKLALSTAHQYFESALIDEDLTFQRCALLNVAYVETVSSCNEMTIDYTTMKLVIVVYGSVMDTNTEAPYLAPCILPKTCKQVQGTSDLSKLLVVQASESVDDSNSKVMGSVNTSPHMTNREYNWKRKDELETGFHYRKRY